MTIDKFVRDILNISEEYLIPNHRWNSVNLINDALCLLIVVLALISVISGLKTVPFHPDEATQVFMSGDLEILAKDPLSLAWESGELKNPRLILRFLDAPLTRYLIGVGRLIKGLPANPVDWNWGSSWAVNQASGAYPSIDLLVWGRLVPSILLPLSLGLVYTAFRRLGHPWLGLGIALFLLINPLILLHTRRAMAEAGMLFSLSLFVFMYTNNHRSPVIFGLAAALAINAKQSLFVLVPFGLAILLITNGIRKSTLRRRLTSSLQYIFVILFLTFLLNPFIWKNPLLAFGAAWNARQNLLSRQVADLQVLAPDKVADTPAKAAGTLLAQAYILPPASEDFNNYHPELAQVEIQYFSYLPHRWLRGFIWGGLFFILGVFGIVSLPLQKNLDSSTKKCLTGLAVLSLLMFLSLAFVVSLPFQRYALPIVFFGCIWTVIDIDRIVSITKTVIKTNLYW